MTLSQSRCCQSVSVGVWKLGFKTVIFDDDDVEVDGAYYYDNINVCHVSRLISLSFSSAVPPTPASILTLTFHKVVE